MRSANPAVHFDWPEEDVSEPSFRISHGQID